MTEQIERNQAAIRLLTAWRAEASQYDEKAWRKLSKAIDANRLALRRRLKG